MDSRTDIELVRAAQLGESAAFAALFDRWFDRVSDVARNIVRDPQTANDVASDVFVSAWRSISSLRQPESFGGWLLRSSRNQALTRLERERRQRPADPSELAMIERADAATKSSAELADGLDPELVTSARETRDLIWAAAAALGERDASVLDLHLRHGLDAAELAEELGVSTNAAHQSLFRMKKKLGSAIQAWACWKRRDRCPELQRAIEATGCERFDSAAIKAIEAHITTCASCAERRAAVVSPIALYAAVPIVAVPVLFRANAAGALEAAGVPEAAGTLETTGTLDGNRALETTGTLDGNRAARRTRRLAATAVAAAFLVAGAVGVAVSVAHRDTDERARTAPVSSTTNPAPTSTSATTTTMGSGDPPLTSDAPTAPPASTTTRTRPTTTTPAPAPGPTPEPPVPTNPPRITSFAVTSMSDPMCASGKQATAKWSADGATAATLTRGGVTTSVSPTAGSVSECVPESDTTFTLTVTNADGSDSRSENA